MQLSFTASIVVFLAGACLFIFSAKKAFEEIEENRCEMTYMFEYPKYIRLNLKKQLSEQFPRYNLYLYGEGQYADDLRNLKPRGIPVLFIPGNAGSYKQVRSFASVALRKAETRSSHFNYFTVDFDEELSGLFGGVLLDQTKFVHSCLKHILRMYKANQHIPVSVVLIGHSMGGLVAGALFSLEEFQPSMVHTIITLGTPHTLPVISLDTELSSFYNKLNNIWQESVVANVTIVSICGGSRDLLVPTKFCSLPDVTTVAFHHSVVSTAIPYAWLTIDHLALCWCKQLVLVVNRALFDMIDRQSGQIQQSSFFRSQVLKKYFGYSDGRGKPVESGVLKKIESLTPQATEHRASSKIGKPELLRISQTILIPTKSYEEHSHFAAVTTSLNSIKISSCKILENNTCIGMGDVPSQTLPTSHGAIELVHIPPATLSKISHIIVSTSKPKSMPRLFVQFTNDINKLFTNLSSISESVQTFPKTNSLLTNISLPMVQNNYVYDVYLIRVVRSNCKDKQSGIFGAKIYVPWFYEDVYADFVTRDELKVFLKIHTVKSLTVSTELYPSLFIWNVGQCSLDVHIQYHFGQSMGQLFKMYAAETPKWVYYWIAVIVITQLSEGCNVHVSSDFWSCFPTKELWKYIPLSIVCEAVSRLLRSKKFTTQDLILEVIFLHQWILPHFFVISSALGVILCLLYFLKSLSWVVFHRSSNVSKLPREKEHFSACVLRCSIFACCIFALCYFSASIALYFLTFILFINTCNRAREFKTVFLKKNINSTAWACNHLRFSETMLLFFLIVSFQATPAFISWLKVIQVSWFLPSDPFRPLLLVLVLTVMMYLVNVKLKKTPSYTPFALLFIWSIGFASSSLDKLPFLLGVVFLTVSISIPCETTTEHIKTQ